MEQHISSKMIRSVARYFHFHFHFINNLAMIGSRTKPTTPELGRWNYSYDDASLDLKVRLANEDHCGVCETRNLEIKHITTRQNQTTDKDKDGDTDVFCYIAECCGNGCPGCDIFAKLTKDQTTSHNPAA